VKLLLKNQVTIITKIRLFGKLSYNACAMQKRIDFYTHALDQLNASEVYFGHGTECAEDEVWWLMASVLRLPIEGDFEVLMDAPLTEAEWHNLEQVLMQRIQKRIPLAYLLHEAYQNGYQFYVDERVLIPRSPIAELIQNQFQPWIREEAVTQILDLCTGSGCLAILAAYAFPEAQVVGSDLSADALEVAAKNVALHQMQRQVSLAQSNVFGSLGQGRYDIIVSNPPYVDAPDFESMPKEYQHEPSMALEAGADGLEIVRQILKEAKSHLTPGGILVVEVGNSASALEAAFPDLPFIWLDFERGGDGVFLLREADL